MPNVSRESINALLPQGAIWVPAEGLDLDLLLEGVSDSLELIREDVSGLAYLRSPLLTNNLDDLEKEFGLIKNTSLTEDERRQALQSTKTNNNGTGTGDFMQKALRDAGFDLRVYINDPPTDPAPFVDTQFQWHFGDVDNAIYGNENMVYGRSAGELIVNGINDDQFSTPTNPDHYGMVFFIGGNGSARSIITGELVQISSAQIPFSRSSELLRLITRYKPAHSWCGLIAEFI